MRDFTTIAEQLVYSTIRVEALTQEGPKVGTGTIYLQKFRDRDHMFLVMNKHLIMDADTVTFIFTRAIDGLPQIGKGIQFRIKNFQQCWEPHPNPSMDIGIFQLGIVFNILGQRGDHIFTRGIPSI